MREINKEMAIARIGNDIGITWAFFRSQPGAGWKAPFDLTDLDLSLTLSNPLAGEIAIHDFVVADNSIHWVFKGKDQSKLGKYTLTLTLNKGQDNQHVVDRIEFLELVSRSNSGVIRHGCTLGDRSVLETDGIVLGTVVDYGYETVAHAMMTYARKEDLEALQRNAYQVITKLAEGFFKVDYDALDEEYARDYFEHRAPALNAGGCSVVAHGGLVGRNMDWPRHHPDGSVDAVFEVHTSAAQGRYASFGFAGSLAELSVEKVESREYSDAYRLLPYYLQDGVNEKGLMAAILVVPATTSRVIVPEDEKRDRVCSLALVRYILDHYQSVDEAVDSLRSYVEIFHPASLTAMGYEPHFFMKDSSKSVVLEFTGTGLVAIEINACTNFHLHGVTFNPDGTVWTNADVLDGHLPSSQGIENYGSGLERFNAMVAASLESMEDMRELLDSILFSKAYTLTEGVWNSEFVGGVITVDTPSDDPALLARLEEYRQKYADDSDEVWITKQSVIYDLANLSASLTVFEGEDEYKAALAQNENVATKEYVEQRVVNFITKSVNDLVNYYLKSETYSKAEVQALISTVQQFTYVALPVLPEASASTMHKIYLVPSSEPEVQNVKDEFITIDNGPEADTRYTWEQIGSTTIDLSNYPTFAQMTSAINTALADYVTASALTLLLAGKQDALTSEQAAAVNSGVTAAKVLEIGEKYVKPQTGIPATDLADPVQEKLEKVTSLELNVGDLDDLDTTAKSNLVAAVNEVKATTGIPIDANFVGFFDASTDLPTVTEPSFAMVGTNVAALACYKWNDSTGGWVQLGSSTYDFTGKMITISQNTQTGKTSIQVGSDPVVEVANGDAVDSIDALNQIANLNLLNQAATETDKAFSGHNNGVIRDSSGWSLTDYILLKANTTYNGFGFYFENFYCFYDSITKEVISNPDVVITYDNSDKYTGTISVGANNVYFRGSWLRSKSNPFISPYIDYYVAYGEKDFSFVSPHNMQDIRLLKANVENVKVINLNEFDVSKIYDNHSINNSGSISESDAWALSDYILLKANTTYYSFGFWLETFFCVYNLNKVVTSASKVSLHYYDSSQKALGTIICGNEDVYIRLSWLKSNANPYVSQYTSAWHPYGSSDYSFVSNYLMKKSCLLGRKVAIIGDSISAYNYGNYNKWVQVLQSEGFLPMDALNSSIHATGFVTDGSYGGGSRAGDNFLTRLMSISTPSSYDYVIVFGGVNDYIQSVPFGESGQSSESYFIPAVESFFAYLAENFVNASIIVITPLYRAEHSANTIGKTEDDYISVIKANAGKYHLPILDATNDAGFYPDVTAFKNAHTHQSDGLHPDAEWSESRLAPFIRSFIEQHIKY